MVCPLEVKDIDLELYSYWYVDSQHKGEEDYHLFFSLELLVKHKDCQLIIDL